MSDADTVVEAVTSPRAANAETESPEPRTTAVAGSRRPMRESAVKPEIDPASAQEESATQQQQQQRRSQRSVKSTYATAATATKEPSKRESVGKKTLKTGAEHDVAGEAERPSEPPPRRTRSTRAATAVGAPPTETAQPPASPVKADPAVANGGGSGEGVAPPPPTPPRNRRPSRRQVDVDGTTAASKQQQQQQNQHHLTTKAHLILDTFRASDAMALCEVVWYQIKENSHRADVLLRDKSPATIDWSRVAQRLTRAHDVALAPRDCQRLWKFLSYGIDTVDGNTAKQAKVEKTGEKTEEEEEEEEEEEPLLADSDPEDYELTTAEINARGKSARDARDTQETTRVVDVTAEPPSQELHAAATTTPSSLPEPAVATLQTTQRETLRTTGVQLFPVYDQPSGVPDAWRNRNGYGTNLPLVFVAEKFLKRKPITGFPATASVTTTAAAPGPAPARVATTIAPSPTGTVTATATATAPATVAAASASIVDASVLAAAAASVVLSGEKLQSKYKRKRKSDGGMGDAGDGGVAGGSEKKPRKKKAPSVAKTPLAASGSVANAKSPGPVATPTATTSSGRQSYVPSTTPPPLPTPARSAFAFFCHLYQQNPTIGATSGALDPSLSTDATATTTATATVSLERVFAGAPLSVRAACDQMAVDDQRRFDREQLRRRLWEKAVASLHSSPAPSPSPSPSPSRAASAPGPPAPTLIAAASSSSFTSPSGSASTNTTAVVGLVKPANDAVDTTSQIADVEPSAS